MKALLITVAMAMLVLYAGYYLYENTPLKQALNPPNIDPRERLEEDFYLSKAEVVSYNSQGKMNYQINAEQFNHFPHNDTTMILAPDMMLYRDNGTSHIVAQYGKLLPGNEDLELWDDVVMISRSLKGQQSGRLDTDFITLYSNQEIASTSRPVKIVTPTGATTAQGMKAYLQQDRIELLSNVRGIYEHH